MGELGGNTVNVNSILFVGSTPAQTTRSSLKPNDSKQTGIGWRRHSIHNSTVKDPCKVAVC